MSLGWSSTKQRIKCLAQGHSTVPPVRLLSSTPQSGFIHSTTGALLVILMVFSISCYYWILFSYKVDRQRYIATSNIFNCQRPQINRGYLLFSGEYQIYFIECGEKNQYFSRVRSTSENADIFTTRDKIHFVFAVKKWIFFLFYTLRKYRNHNLTFYLVVSRSIWLLQCFYWV